MSFQILIPETETQVSFFFWLVVVEPTFLQGRLSKDEAEFAYVVEDKVNRTVKAIVAKPRFFRILTGYS